MTNQVNNGYRAHVRFPFGWEGEVGIVSLGDRWRMAYPSPLAPPLGFRLRLEDQEVEVRHVERGPLMTVLTLVPAAS